MMQLLLKAAPDRLMLTRGHVPNIDAVCYLDPALDPATRRDIFNKVIYSLRDRAVEFDAFACRGLSGMLVAPIVAVEMHKTLLVVRKSDTDNHSSRMVEGDVGARRYVIVDDLISSGSTVKAIIKEIREVSDAKCVGIIRYWNGQNIFLPYEEFVRTYAPELLPMPVPKKPDIYVKASLGEMSKLSSAVRDGFMTFYSYQYGLDGTVTARMVDSP